MLGGWQISVITMLQTGQFLTPTVTIPDPTGSTYTTSANRPLVTIRPDVLSNPNLQDPTIAAWYNVNAFTAPPIVRLGNSSRGLVIGPGENLWHAGLQKYFVFADNPRMPRLRVDLYSTNVFNHPNWGNPSTNLSAPGLAGTITTSTGANAGSLGDNANARTMRFALRLEW